MSSVDSVLLIRGGTLLAGTDLVQRDGEAIAVRGQRIAWIGPDDQIPSWAAAATSIDASGMTILPGLIDAHAHVEGLGTALDTVDLVGTTSVAEIASRVREAVTSAPAGSWILGRGWDQNDWAVREFPNATDLDAASAGHPVWLSRIDGHAGLANTAAIRAAGITSSTPDPAGGRILRDGRGNPTGVFIDSAMNYIDAVVPPPSRKLRKERIAEAAAAIASRGLTAVHDAGVDQQAIQLMRELVDEGKLPIRVYALLGDDDDLVQSWLERGPLLDYGNALTVRSIKLYADGALGSRGAALLAPYSDDPGNEGLLLSTAEHVESRARHAVERGFQIGTHAIGDRAVRLVLEAYRRAGVQPEHRFRIEHLQVVAPEDFAPLASRGIIASMQPTHATSDMPWAERRLGPERVKGAYAWRTVLDSGGRLALGSDFPVESVDPFLGLYAAVTRMDLDGHPAGGWMADEKLSIREAVRGFSLDAAWAAFEEKDRGSIEVGKFADFTIVEGNPMSADPSTLPETRVRYTIVNGRLVHSAP
ncbi:MAG TPA: amidohydrolase [Thermoanaerobaculia bacterium]|nr:amidohydrolase [Thermoanaerobaculia bacterium]